MAFVAYFETQNFHLNTKIDMKHKISKNYKNGNDANRLLAAADFNSPENQNRDRAIIGYGPVLKCKCEMPAKMHGNNICRRCKRSLS